MDDALTREQWLDARRSGIGGSEAACLYDRDAFGKQVHPYMSPLKLWAIKTGKATDGDEAHPLTSPALWWGSALEEPIRKAYPLITGRDISPGVSMLAHPSMPFMVANTDATVHDAARGTGVGEFKTTMASRRGNWDAGIPLYHQVQCQHYMACTGYQWASLAVYFAGDRQPLRVYDIERSDEFIGDLMGRIERFWLFHVLADVPPDADGSEVTSKLLADILPEPELGLVVELPEEWMAWADRVATIGEEIGTLMRERDGYRNRIKQAMGAAEFGKFPDGSGYTLREVSRGSHTVQASTSRQLREIKNVDKAAVAAAKKRTK